LDSLHKECCASAEGWDDNVSLAEPVTGSNPYGFLADAGVLALRSIAFGPEFANLLFEPPSKYHPAIHL
jgi:hypothetical protein